MARAQRGLITWPQLLEAGVSRSTASRRMAKGGLHRVHPGVYLVGHAVAPPLALELAALLVSGEDARLSDHTAAWLWNLVGKRPDSVDVTVVGRQPARRAGIRAHRTARLDRADIRRRHGLALTSPARTILDLAAHLSPRELERILAEATTRRLTSADEMRAALGRAPRRRRGADLVRELLAEAPRLTRSEAERDFLELLRNARLPTPQTNVRLCGFEVDCFWRAERLVVEIDGFTYHSSAKSYDRDRVRDDELEAAGYRVRRVTYRQIHEDPYATVARVARALGSAG